MSTSAYSFPALSSASTATAVPSMMRQQLRGILFDTLVPLGMYAVLRRSFGFTEVQALMATAAQPLCAGLHRIVSGTRLSPTNVLAFAGILVNLVALALGGDAQVLLLRESLLTAALGVACLASLPSKRPLMFLFVRHFQVGSDKALVATFNQRLLAKPFLQSMRVMTAVWGVAMIAEFSLRAWMVMYCTPETVLAVSPFLLNGTIVATIAWSVRYGKRRQARFASSSGC